MAEYVREALRVGPHGWEVDRLRRDAHRQLVHARRRAAVPARAAATAGDFRGLTPLVLAQALAQAGTVVCEPILHIRLELPAASLGAVMAAARRLDATLEQPTTEDATATLEGALAAVRLSGLQRQLPGLTRGEGVLESSFAGYRPAVSAVPG